MKRSIFVPTLLFLLLITATPQVYAVETCSRTAIINYQEIFVDTNSTQKGDGLRYYLEQDVVAKNYLEKYQEGAKIQWPNVALGTTGTMMALAGITLTKDNIHKRTLIIGGLSILMLNFLVARTISHNNEHNLQKAVDEYNKRNLPRIYFDPWHENPRKSNDIRTQYNPTIIFEIARSF